MCVDMYIYICIHTPVYTCMYSLYTYINMLVYIHIHAYTCFQAYLSLYAYSHPGVDSIRSLKEDPDVFLTYPIFYLLQHGHTYIHIYIYIHIPSFGPSGNSERQGRPLRPGGARPALAAVPTTQAMSPQLRDLLFVPGAPQARYITVWHIYTLVYDSVVYSSMVWYSMVCSSMNRRLLHSVLEPKASGIAATMACRLLRFMCVLLGPYL